MMHEDVLLAVLVEIHQPGAFLVVGQDDRHLLRPPGEQIRPGHADKAIQLPDLLEPPPCPTQRHARGDRHHACQTV